MSKSTMEIISSGVGTIATIKVSAIALKQLETMAKTSRGASSTKNKKPY